MFGAWKATCYLRLWYFTPLKTFFQYAFQTGIQSTKLGGRKALKGTTAFLLQLVLAQFCLQPDRGPVCGGWRKPNRLWLRPDRGFLESHCCHICNGSALSACDTGVQQSHLATRFPILLPPCDEDKCSLSQITTFLCM